MRGRKGDYTHSSRVCRADASGSVLDDYASLSRNMLFRCGKQVSLRIGFATLHIVRRDEH
jgi:hypothetical protein